MVADARLAPRHVFLFSSQGGQWPGMGLELFQDEPCFRQTLTECDQIVQRSLGWSPVKMLIDGEESVAEVGFVQPLVTSIQIALAWLLKSRGIAPAAVVGLSMGEAAAAYSAGALDLETAMRIVCSQARLTQRHTQPGKMILVPLGRGDVAELLSHHVEGVELACELSPTLTVLSGEAVAVSRAALDLRTRNVPVRDLSMGRFAYHSSGMAPLQGEFCADLGDVAPRPGDVRLYSSVTGTAVPNTVLTADYWWRIMSRPAYFVTPVRRLLDDGYRSFVEVGPHPTLSRFVEEIARVAGHHASVVATLRRGRGNLPDLSDWPLEVSPSRGC